MIDFERIASAALAQSEQLVSAWLPGGRQVGPEWCCGSLSGGAGDSCKVNLRTGKWADFATEERGADLISLAAAVRGVRQAQAARELAGELGIETALGLTRERLANVGARAQLAAVPAPAQSPPDAKWTDAGAWPPDGPAMPIAHYVRGAHTHRWIYRDSAGRVLGAVSRYTTSDGGKDILPLVWSKPPAAGGALAWRWRAFDEPRPLYGMDQLAARPDALVLVVEGEKCAQIAQELLPDLVVITWPGGGKAVAKANWQLLVGREVIVWPDCDAQVDKTTGALLPAKAQPGNKAAAAICAALAGVARAVYLVKIPEPGAVKSGWDIADAIDEAGEEARARVREMLDAARPAPPVKAAHRRDPDSLQAQLRWGRDHPLRSLSNVELVLARDPRWAGVIAFDSFASRIIKRTAPPYAHAQVGDWTEQDDTLTAIWIAREYACDCDSKTVAEAVRAMCPANSFHPVRDWLSTLTWDGVDRLSNWAVRIFGTADTPYARAVGAYFLRGMVRRVMAPGCKFDYCLVLEGEQGIGKSSACAVLAGDYYSDTDLDLTHKDSMGALQGVWLHEFAEMDSIARAEAPKQKSFLSRQADKYRPPYARAFIDCPRQTVFVGSTNETEYLRDATGARRFWPLACARVDLAALKEERAQLFAQAAAELAEGARCYPLPDEQQLLFNPEQRARKVREGLVDGLYGWVHSDERFLSQTDGRFTLYQAAAELGISGAHLTRDNQTRIGLALKELKCERIEQRNNADARKWYRPPPKVAAHPAGETGNGDGDDAIPF